jgi:hypothetical protein
VDLLIIYELKLIHLIEETETIEMQIWQGNKEWLKALKEMLK